MNKPDDYEVKKWLYDHCVIGAKVNNPKGDPIRWTLESEGGEFGTFLGASIMEYVTMIPTSYVLLMVMKDEVFREVRDWLEKASVVAVPSVTAANGDSEGLPTILLEAQAMAVPIVATRHSGIPEGVIEGKTAELVEERDSLSLADKLQSFLESPSKTRAFGEAGRRFVSENFNIRVQACGLEDIYADAYARYMTQADGRH